MEAFTYVFVEYMSYNDYQKGEKPNKKAYSAFYFDLFNEAFHCLFFQHYLASTCILYRAATNINQVKSDVLPFIKNSTEIEIWQYGQAIILYDW